MRHRRKKRNANKHRKSFVLRVWHWIVKLFDDWNEVQKELAEIGIYFTTSWTGATIISHFDTGKKLEEKDHDVSSRSRKKRRSGNT